LRRASTEILIKAKEKDKLRKMRRLLQNHHSSSYINKLGRQLVTFNPLQPR